MGKPASKREVYLIVALLIVITAAVYWQVTGFDLITMDDTNYVKKNPMVAAGLMSMPAIERAFVLPYEDNYIPLVWVSYMADHDFASYVLDSQSASIYHVSNLIQHIANALLLFAVLLMLTGSRWRSAFVAGLFAIHPVHVESVAWVAERKDTLSTLFWMLTMLAYVRYVRVPDTRRYALVVVFYALGLLAKPMLVTLPIMLVLLDYWPLKRLGATEGEPGVTLAGIRRAISEKMLLFILAAAGCAGTLYVQGKVGAVAPLRAYPVGVRIANAFVAYASYLIKMVYPRNLALYSHKRTGIPEWQTVGAVLMLAVITAGVIKLRRRYPCLLFGWIWYVVTLVPVIGLVQVGWQAMADRYTYIPLIGIFVAIAWAVPEMLSGKIGTIATNRLLGGASVAAMVVLLPLTYIQIGYWQNDIALYEHSVKVNPSSPMAHYNYGTALGQAKRYDEALREFKICLKSKPDYSNARYGLAAALAHKGRRDEAMKECRTLLRANPRYIQAYRSLGEMLAEEGKLDEAITQFRTALKVSPHNQECRQDLDKALLQKQGGDE